MKTSQWVWTGWISVGVVAAGCAAGGHFDPLPVAGPVADSGARQGFSEASMEAGRDLYATRCGRCHSLVPPEKRTAEQWEKILPRMTRKANLDGDQSAAVRSYILAAHGATAAK